ncbi:MAG: hypothetical protein ACOYOS_21870 [Syntrophales bacterium]
MTSGTNCVHKHNPSAEYRFFLFDPEGDGTIFFRSESDRDTRAKEAIDEYKSDGEGWAEDVKFVCTGAVTHVMTKVNITKRPPPEEIDEDGHDDEGNWWGDWEEMCNYELVGIGIE